MRYYSRSGELIRGSLGNHAILSLNKILRANFPTTIHHEAFLDEGINPGKHILDEFFAAPEHDCNIPIDQDSRIVAGIQLADLCAHTLGIMLLEHMGYISKRVKPGEDAGYHPEDEVELGFILWASLRHLFFRADQPKPGPVPDDPVGELLFDVENYGLYIADSSPVDLKNNAKELFGENYLGCIH